MLGGDRARAEDGDGAGGPDDAAVARRVQRHGQQRDDDGEAHDDGRKRDALDVARDGGIVHATARRGGLLPRAVDQPCLKRFNMKFNHGIWRP